MGGHPEGEVAAQLALQTISALYQKEARPQVKDPTEFLSTALMAAHHQIIRYAGEKGMLDTPRTTLVAAIVQNGCATWVHCGDSRLYLVRDGELMTRTRDHSYLEQQNAGVIRLDRINRNILFTCLGSPTKPVYDIAGPTPLQQGDKVLLCSDGLWGNIEDLDIAAQLGARSVSDAVPRSTYRYSLLLVQFGPNMPKNLNGRSMPPPTVQPLRLPVRVVSAAEPPPTAVICVFTPP